MPKETASTPAENEFEETLDEEQVETTDSDESTEETDDAETDDTETVAAAAKSSKLSEKERIQRSKDIAAKAQGKTPKKGKATPKRNAKSRKLEVEESKRASMTKEQLRASGKTQRAKDANPVWFKPIMFGFLLLGFVWIIVYYMSQGYFPVQALGDWNILVGFGIALVGFLMMTNWK